MSNKSHYNSGLRSLNRMNRDGIKHSSYTNHSHNLSTNHYVIIDDCVTVLKSIPSNSIQLILIDPPYNLDLEKWDSFSNYIDWAKNWLEELYRILSPSGNCVIFGGFQYQDIKKGDLLEILYHLRHRTNLRFINLIIWHYKNGMSAHRFFANRHEECAWFSKTNKYYFDLDSVREKYDEISKKAALKDKRLNKESVEKGKNPTNVWDIGRLSGNSKERVGHPTQKPVEIIRRLVKALSYEGSIVLDFFAGSGTTGRVCIEENRNSILVDNNPSINDFLKKHINNIPESVSRNIATVKYDSSINDVLNFIETQHLTTASTSYDETSVNM